MPSKSQIALALIVQCPRQPQAQYMSLKGHESLRLGVDLVQEASTILFGENACEAPRLILQWLHILDVYDQNITWLSVLDLEGTCQIVDPGQVDITHIVRAIVVANLAAGPVHALDLDRLSILDRSNIGDCITSVCRWWDNCDSW